MAYFLASLILCFGIFLTSCSSQAETPVFIGVNINKTQQSDISILRGAEIAVDEINAAGGLLGHPVVLKVKDTHDNPARGKDNILEFAQEKNLLAVLGGTRTPVALAEIPLIQEHKLIYLSPWAAGTSITQNTYTPNYVFRVSVRDDLANLFLLKSARDLGYQAPCLLLENTAWGRSNQDGFNQAASDLNYPLMTTQWFNLGTQNFSDYLDFFQKKECDIILLVAVSPDGWFFIKRMQESPNHSQTPILSHWGILTGNFKDHMKGVDITKIQLKFLQTFSFLDQRDHPLTQNVIQKYIARYGDADLSSDIFAPTGTAHSYDLIHFLALAVKQAKSFNHEQIRENLEKISSHNGLVKTYNQPFTEQRHDALTIEDYKLAYFNEHGDIIIEAPHRDGGKK